MLFGMNPDTDKILQLLNKSRDDFGRFRNVYMSDGYIIVHTRCGGGNRESYEYVFEEMSQHPWYSHDEDDDFDSTYADIYFKVPQKVEGINELNVGQDPKAQWDKLFKLLDESKS